MVNPPPTQADRDWKEIESLVAEVDQLSKSDVAPPKFYEMLCDRAMKATAAVAVAVWLRRDAKQMSLESQRGLETSGLGVDSAVDQAHGQTLNEAISRSETCVAPPKSDARATQLDLEIPLLPSNPTDFYLTLAPLVVDGETLGLLEILHPQDTNQQSLRGYSDLLSVLAELVGEYESRQKLRELQHREGLWSGFDQFAQRVNGSLLLDRTAYTIVNEGRRLINCDRLSLLEIKGRRCEVLAISGIDKIERRSNVVRTLQSLAAKVAATDEPLFSDGSPADLPPQLETALHDYVDESKATVLAVVPLAETVAISLASEQIEDKREKLAAKIGVLVAEQFQVGTCDDAFRQRVEAVGRHSATAMDNALSIRRVPFFSTLHSLGRSGWLKRSRSTPIALGVCLLLAAIVAALWLIPAPFTVVGRGELTPETKHIVFSPNDGEVETLHLHGLDIENDDNSQLNVAAGQPLLDLRNLELEAELQRIIGERKSAEQRRDSLEKNLLHAPRTSPEAVRMFNEMAAEHDGLAEKVKWLRESEKTLSAQQAKLKLVSRIDGRVLTWDVEQLLESRPVQRGQVLLTIADLGQDWILEVHVADKHIGYALDQQRRLREKDEDAELTVTFMLAANPGVKHVGRVIEISPAADLSATEEEPTVLVKIAIDKDDVAVLRPGAEVIAHIDCGTQPVGYVWLHDVIEAARTWFFF